MTGTPDSPIPASWPGGAIGWLQRKPSLDLTCPP